MLLPEIESLQKLIQVLDSIYLLASSREPNTYEYLTKLLEEAHILKVPADITHSLEDLVCRTEKLIDKIKNLIQENVNKYSNIEEIKICIQETQEYKVLLPEIKNLIQIKQSYDWSEKVKASLHITEQPNYEQIESIGLQVITLHLDESYTIQPLIGPAKNLQLKMQQVLWVQKNKFVFKLEQRNGRINA